MANLKCKVVQVEASSGNYGGSIERSVNAFLESVGNIDVVSTHFQMIDTSHGEAREPQIYTFVTIYYKEA